MLLEAVKGELRLVVDKNFKGLHKSSIRTGGIYKWKSPTLAMNFLHVSLISLAKVALNIMTCLWCGVARNIS